MAPGEPGPPTGRTSYLTGSRSKATSRPANSRGRAVQCLGRAGGFPPTCSKTAAAQAAQAAAASIWPKTWTARACRAASPLAKRAPTIGTARGSVTSPSACSASARRDFSPASFATSSGTASSADPHASEPRPPPFRPQAAPCSPSDRLPSCTPAASRPPRAGVEPNDRGEVRLGLALQPFLLAP